MPNDKTPAGMFDDLIPQQNQQGGMFDDLIPKATQHRSGGAVGDIGLSLQQDLTRIADWPGKAVRFATGFMGITPEWAKDSGEWADRRVAEMEAVKTPEGQLADHRLNQVVVDRPPTEEDVLPPGTAGMMGSGFATGETRPAPQYQLQPENITARGVANAAAGSLPSMAAQYVLGRGVTGALNTAGKVGKLAEEAAVAAKVKNAAIGQASTNATVVAAQTFDDTYAEAKKAGLSDEEALKRAYEASGIVAPVAAATGGALGMVVTPGAKAAGRGFGKAAAKLAGVIGGGAAEEGTENLTQTGAQNVAMGRDFINADSLNSALQGAVVGGPFALGAHGAERLMERGHAPAPAVDANTVLDAETPQQAPLALPAPRVIVSQDGQARVEGSNRVFDEKPARVSGRAPEEVRQAVRDELQALGYEPAQRATPTPITVDASGQARTDEQTPTRDVTVEPPAKTVGRAPVELRAQVAEELKALGYDPTPRATPTPIVVAPDGEARTQPQVPGLDPTLEPRARAVGRAPIELKGERATDAATPSVRPQDDPVNTMRLALRQELAALGLAPAVEYAPAGTETPNADAAATDAGMDGGAVGTGAPVSGAIQRSEPNGGLRRDAGGGLVVADARSADDWQDSGELAAVDGIHDEHRGREQPELGHEEHRPERTGDRAGRNPVRSDASRADAQAGSGNSLADAATWAEDVPDQSQLYEPGVDAAGAESGGRSGRAEARASEQGERVALPNDAPEIRRSGREGVVDALAAEDGGGAPEQAAKVAAFADALGREAQRRVEVRLLDAEPGSRGAALAADVKRRLGVDVVYFHSDDPAAPAGASVVGIPGTVFVGTKTRRPEFVVGHELLHELRTAHPDIYQGLAATLRQYARDMHANAADIQEDYKAGGSQQEVSPTVIEEENVADVAGKAFADPAFWEAFHQAMRGEPPSKVQQFFRWLARWFTKHFDKIDLTSELDRAASLMRDHIAAAYAEAAKRNGAVRSVGADIEFGVRRARPSQPSQAETSNYREPDVDRSAFDGEVDVTREARGEYARLFGEPVEMASAEPEYRHARALQPVEEASVSAALDDLARAGMPADWLGDITRVFAYTGSNLGKAAYMAKVGPQDTAVIALTHNGHFTVPTLDSASMSELQQLRGALAHEIAHHVDRQPGHTYGFSAESPRLQLRLDEKRGELRPVGDLAKELVAVYRGDSPLADLLEYPLGAYIDGDMLRHVAQQELFAQAVRAFFTNRSLLKSEAPLTYGVLDAIVYGQGTATQNVQEALRGRNPDARGSRTIGAGSARGGRAQDAAAPRAAAQVDRPAVADEGRPGRRGGVPGRVERIAERNGARGAIAAELASLSARESAPAVRRTGRKESLVDEDGSRAAKAGASATKVAAPVTVAAQAANKLADRIGEEIARVTGAKKVGEKVVGAVDAAIAKKSSWSWVERAKQGLISDYGLPEEYLTAKIAKQSRENKLLREAKHTLDRLSGMNPDQLAVAYQWLQEKPDSARERDLISRLPADQRDVLHGMKDDIDRLSREAVKLGLISQETYERNRMAYVHRSYKKYEAELSGSEIAARQRAQRLKGDQFKGRGMELEANLDRVHGDLPQELKGLKLDMLEKRDADGRLRRREFVVAGQARSASLRDYTSAGTWEVRDATKDGHLKVWRDFTLAERQRMGEIEDARYGFARTMLQGVRDVETARFLRWTASNYARKSPEGLKVVEIRPLAQVWGTQAFTRDEWVKVPDTNLRGTNVKRYGELAGMYLPGVMWNDMMGLGNSLDGLWDKLMTAWKISKTALSPAVHVNNVMANFIMADLADVGAEDIRKSLRTILAAKGGDAEAKKLIERYEDSGAESGSFAANEIKTSVLQPLLQQIAENEPEAVQKASLAQVVSLLAHGKVGEAASASTRTLPGRAIGGTVEGMIRAYQSEDSVFRLAKFMNEIEAGKTDLQAGRAAREAFLNYDINAPWVRAARRTVLPFVSFTYRAVPLLARAMATKPWKFAKYAAMGYALNMLAYGMLGDQGDEEKEKRLLPDEMQGTYYGIPKMMRLPWNSGDNDPMWVDVRRWLPGGDVADVNNSKSAVPLPQWLSVGGPLSLLIDFYSNTNSRGDKIVHPSDSPGQVIEKASDMLLKFVLPNLPVPGLGWALRQVGAPVDTGMLDPYAWSAIERSMNGSKSPAGRQTSGAEAVASAVGVKVQSRRITDEMMSVDRQFKAQQRDIKTEIARVKGAAASGRIGQEEAQRRIQREVEKLRELGKKTTEKLTPQH